MARPETIEDLESYDRSPHEFVRVDPQFLTADVSVGAALLTLIDAARKSDAFEVSEDGLFTVSVPLTLDEIDRKIASAQRSWDLGRDDYNDAMSGARLIEKWRRAGVDRWVSREDVTPVDWVAHDEAMAVPA